MKLSWLIFNSWKSRQEDGGREFKTRQTENRQLQVILGLVGFLLSVVFVFWGMLVLVRFWIYSNILYNIFILSMLLAGIVFNISALNLIFSEETVRFSNCLKQSQNNSSYWFQNSNYVKPFVYGTAFTIFWNIIGIVLPFYYDGICTNIFVLIVSLPTDSFQVIMKCFLMYHSWRTAMVSILASLLTRVHRRPNILLLKSLHRLVARFLTIQS